MTTTGADVWRSRIKGHRRRNPATLRANSANWRTHPPEQRKALTDVLDRVGWVQDVIVNLTTGNLIDGHLRVDVALERGERMVPTVEVELSEEEERLILATLDPMAAMAGVNVEALGDLLRSISLAPSALADLLDSLALRSGIELVVPQAPTIDPDAVPDLKADPSVQPGELYALGDHRVLCGSSVVREDVLRLFGGAVADAMVTDPPYGIDYHGKVGSQRERIDGDKDTEIARLALALAADVLRPGAAAYVCYPTLSGWQFIPAFIDAGFHPSSSIVWVKNHHTFTRTDYKAKHESVLYGSLPGADPDWYGDGQVEEVPANGILPAHEEWVYGWREGGAHTWRGGPRQTTVWEIPRPAASRLHPTMKPVALIERCISNSTSRGQVVYDPFLGSGTALIAAEGLQRRCFALEIDRRYADVAMTRWEQFTGRLRERIA